MEDVVLIRSQVGAICRFMILLPVSLFRCSSFFFLFPALVSVRTCLWLIGVSLQDGGSILLPMHLLDQRGRGFEALAPTSTSSDLWIQPVEHRLVMVLSASTILFSSASMLHFILAVESYVFCELLSCGTYILIEYYFNSQCKGWISQSHCFANWTSLWLVFWNLVDSFLSS